MITLSRTTQKEIKEFHTVEWRGVDVEHYGKSLEWREESITFKAEKDREIVGTIGVKFEAGVLYIQNIIVGNAHRGEGVGRLLMEKAEEFGRSHGAHKSYLHTGKGWEAEKFYTSLGYRKTGELKNHYFHHDFVIFEKQLLD